ncbi:MAG: HAD-IA family hydrolase, partial [Syntrophothermus sp.]
IENIRDTYNLFLLSNTNIIHYRKYLHDFQMKFGYKSFEDLFKKFYLSYEIGLIKPGREVFDFVLQDAKLDPAETLFVDDTPENVEGSLKAGLIGYYLREGEDIASLFTEE